MIYETFVLTLRIVWWYTSWVSYVSSLNYSTWRSNFSYCSVIYELSFLRIKSELSHSACWNFTYCLVIYETFVLTLRLVRWYTILVSYVSSLNYSTWRSHFSYCSVIYDFSFLRIKSELFHSACWNFTYCLVIYELNFNVSSLALKFLLLGAVIFSNRIFTNTEVGIYPFKLMVYAPCRTVNFEYQHVARTPSKRLWF